LLVSTQVALAQFTQQGPKLVGSGTVPPSGQGHSVALSGDGNTAVVGGYLDNSDVGAAWVYTRSGGVWTQQGSKLVGTDAVPPSAQGFSVALSADGNTAVVGGLADNSNAGAAWVYTRSGGVWTQQSKLVGTGAVGNAGQGVSVALSDDGNTALVGGFFDNSDAGAAWVYTRSGGVWTQQGSKLVGTGTVPLSGQGYSVALSGDGNTAVVGGYLDNSDVGAAWVYTRSGGVWTQQGNKLVGTDAVPPSAQGFSVALSADGNTAVVGGYLDNSDVGAAWVYTRSGGVWTQQGSKLVGTGAVGNAGQGVSIALSRDGNTAIVGGFFDNSDAGAAWVYTRGGGVWTQQGSKLVGTGAVGNAGQGVSVALSGDGNAAIVGGYNDNSRAGAPWVFVRSRPSPRLLRPAARHSAAPPSPSLEPISRSRSQAGPEGHR
jgi:antibiotic biosynthesis monooxygenase (ABM) superfamily enzyme